MALLELKNVSKHFGAIHALNDVSLSLEPGQDRGTDGRQRGRQVHPRQDRRRKFSSHAWDDADGRPGIVHAPADRSPPAWDRDRASGSRALRQSQRSRQCFPRPRNPQRRRPVQNSRLCRDVSPGRTDLRRAAIRNPAARSGQADVRRTATGGSHCPNPDCRRQGRSDGRADRGHFGAAGRRGP